MNLLDRISSPSDTRKLSIEELQQLADEVRAYLIESIQEFGGHFSANLGVVELTVCLHKLLETTT